MEEAIGLLNVPRGPAIMMRVEEWRIDRRVGIDDQFPDHGSTTHLRLDWIGAPPPDFDPRGIVVISDRSMPSSLPRRFVVPRNNVGWIRHIFPPNPDRWGSMIDFFLGPMVAPDHAHELFRKGAFRGQVEFEEWFVEGVSSLLRTHPRTRDRVRTLEQQGSSSPPRR
jgi:hypothetical protein